MSTDNQPISGAMVSVNGVEQYVSATGAYTIAVPSGTVFRISASADGYYSFIQTFSQADVSAAATTSPGVVVPPVELVRRRKGRRLFAFAGDTMMGRRYSSPRAGEPVLIRDASAAADTRSVLQHMKPYFELADFASVNLETQLSDAPLTEPLPKSVTFYTTTAIAQALRWAGVDYVALGNNHMFDYGDQGLQQTLAALDEAGLAYSGAGTSEELARHPQFTTTEQQPLALLSYVGWAGGFEPNQVAGSDKGGAALGTRRSIAEDLGKVPDDTLSIIQYHSGIEYMSYPPLAEETQLKSAIDAGADLAIGHHSHVFQGFDIHRGKLVAYSLGNFAFDQYLYSTQSAILLFAWYDGDEFFRAEIVPLHINGYVPTPATGSFRYDILQRLVRLSEPENVCWSRSGEHATFQQCVDGTREAGTQELGAVTASAPVPGSVRHLSLYGADPLRLIRTVNSDSPYRLGHDLLRRGDFEYVGLFDTHDRTWVDDERVSIRFEESMVMDIVVPGGETVITGMKMFTRVFSRSNPASVSGRIRSSGCTTIRFSLQRRLDGMSVSDALLLGPVSEIAQFSTTGPDWSEFTLDFDLPRTSSRSIRLLADIENCEGSKMTAKVQFDDLSLVEWHTPWLASGDPVPNIARTQATHIQFSPTD